MVHVRHHYLVQLVKHVLEVGSFKHLHLWSKLVLLRQLIAYLPLLLMGCVGPKASLVN